MPPDIEDLGGLHEAAIEKLVSDGDAAVKAELLPMIEEVKDTINGVKHALLGHTDELGVHHPGALKSIADSIEEVNSRVTVYDRDRQADMERIAKSEAARAEAEMRRHEEWQEGERIREEQRAKRDKLFLDELKALRTQVDSHEKKFVSRFSKTVAWCVKTYQSGHKKYLVLAAAWASMATAFAAALAALKYAMDVYHKFSGVFHSVVHAIKEGTGK